MCKSVGCLCRCCRCPRWSIPCSARSLHLLRVASRRRSYSDRRRSCLRLHPQVGPFHDSRCSSKRCHGTPCKDSHRVGTRRCRWRRTCQKGTGRCCSQGCACEARGKKCTSLHSPRRSCRSPRKEGNGLQALHTPHQGKCRRSLARTCHGPPGRMCNSERIHHRWRSLCRRARTSRRPRRFLQDKRRCRHPKPCSASRSTLCSGSPCLRR
mmetsp:Transcript_102063/g.243386  ORF Transcript_102063/g.243386 Transcript_102063/m.243386 type:complete len:210 (+) Transcript_102063:867-1496(+)